MKPHIKSKSISKIIHQTCAVKQLAPPYVENINRIKELNPGWEYRLYDDSDIEQYLSKYFPWAMKFYKRINCNYGAVKADFFRYFVTYNEGGVYLDIKSTACKPLDEVIKPFDRYLLSYWNNQPGEEYEGAGFDPLIPLARGGFQQWNIVSAPGHAFLEKVIENVCVNFEKYNPYIDGVGLLAVHRLAGPTAYTLSILPLLKLTNEFRFVDTINDLGFKYTFFDDKVSHVRLDKKHYASQRASILSGNLLGKIKAYPAYRLRRWWERIKRDFLG